MYRTITTYQHKERIFKSALMVCLIASITIFQTGCVGLSNIGPGSYSIKSSWFSRDYKRIKKVADIPSIDTIKPLIILPVVHDERQYSEKIEVRDAISLLILDISKHSIFYKQGDPFIYGPVTVPESGILNIPFIGNVHAMGKDQTELAADIYTTIKSISASAEVAVQRTARLPKRAVVIGQVRHPGPVHLDRRGLRLFDLVAAAGGTPTATHNYSYTLHRDGKSYKYHEQLLNKISIMAEDADILSVEIEPNQLFHVLGAVRRPITVPFPTRHPNVSDALAAGGGLDVNTSNAGGIFIFRNIEGKDIPAIYNINLEKANGLYLASNFDIQGGDIVYVSEAILSKWRRFLGSILPFGQLLESSTRIAAE